MKSTTVVLLLLTIAAPAAAIVGPPPNTIPLPGLGPAGSVLESPAGYGVIRSTALPPASDKQVRQQQELAANPGLKIYVAQEGWYRVTRAAMLAAGFDPGSDLRKLSLYMQGLEQPLQVNADSIEFYGQKLDTFSSGARTYWLRAGQGSAGRLPLSRAKGGDPVTGDVAFTSEKIERSVFAAQIVGNGDSANNWLGPLIWSEPVTQQIEAGNLDAGYGGTATLEVTLAGGIEGPHAIRIDVNGRNAGTATLTNMERKTFELPLPQAWLAQGANSVTFTATGGDWDFSSLVATRLTYQHLLRADNGAFEASLPGGRIAKVGGFPSSAVRAIDVTDATNPVELETAVAADPAGGFSASFTPAGSGARVVLAFEAGRILAPAELQPNRPSTWSDRKGSADLLIISNSAFAQAASALVPVRQRDGINAVVVDVEDLYDEFNFGIRAPEAVRAFLQSAAQWKTRPRWVLLVGDASIDPRNYAGLGAFDFVPTKLVDTFYLKTASDDWLADVDGDGLADYAIGRIPVRTAEDATRVFDKIVFRGTPSGAWANSVLSVFDRPEGYDFAASAAEASALVPSSLAVQTIDYAHSASPESDTIRALNQGHLLVDYVGHGTVDLWGIDSVFHSGDAAALVNGNRLPFVVAMNCLNGYFADVWSTSMAESLLQAPNGGAVAVWASSTLTEPDGQQTMNTALFRQLFGGGNPTIGEAINKAKQAMADPDVRKSWILFGDPSMKLK